MEKIVLTEQQQAVVDDRGGTLLVSAAAGSGKTKVLIDRVLKYVLEGCNVDQFLLITFTQAAAAELRGKLIAQLSKLLAAEPANRHLQQQMNRVYLAQISTVHSFCASLLREFAHELELPSDFRTADDVESEQLREKAMQKTLEEVYTDLSDAQIAHALERLGAGRDDRKLPGLIFAVYDSVQCWKDPDERIAELEKSVHIEGCSDPIDTVWGKYHFDNLKQALSEYEASIERAMQMIEADDRLAPYATNFAADLQIIRELQKAESWAQLQALPYGFGRLKTVKKVADTQTQGRVKAIRTAVKDDLKKRMSVFELSAQDVLEEISITGEAICGLLKLVRRFSAVYLKEKRSSRVLDYNDLEHEVLHLLYRKDGSVSASAKQLAERYREVMVDEYQDTNAVQDTIFRALTQGGNLFMVGDVKQSIYRFRMADPTGFLNRYEAYADYTGAQEGEPRKILLSDNFRSCPEVLSAANDVFGLLMSKRVGGLRYTEAEALRTKAKPHGGMPIELYCLDASDVPPDAYVSNEEIEAEFVARRIEEMLQNGETIRDGETERSIAAEDVAILMRGIRSSAPVYMAALRRHGIDCVCGNENIFDSEEIAVVISLLKVIDNPYQDIPLLHVLFSPLFRFTAERMAQVRIARKNVPIYDALCACREGEEVVEKLTALRRCAMREDIAFLLDEIDAKLYLRAVYPNGEKNFDKLHQLAKSYEGDDHYGLSGFLRYLGIRRSKGVSTELTARKGAVRLMTMHKSKGLEFPVVFLAGLNKKFNDTDLYEDVLVDSKLGIASKLFEPQTATVYATVAHEAISDRLKRDNRSEEMRILYVAMTRAKCRLIMTMCGKNMAKKLEKIAGNMTMPPLESYVAGAQSLGHWLLMCAMTRTEAGELFAVGGESAFSQVTQYPWRIAYRDASAYLPQEETLAQTADEQNLGAFKPINYAYGEAVKLPEKLTATQLKGRMLDDEAAELTITMPLLRFDKPCFEKKRLSATQRGTAIHLAMEHLRFECCTNEASIRQEIQRLTQEDRITKEQADAVPIEKLLRFFTSALGQRVLRCERLEREFKFALLDDGGLYNEALAGEEVMLQGVADLCLLEPDGLVIIDFKSDRIKPGGEQERAGHYAGQLEAYSRALAGIFELPVKERFLYFFETDQTVAL